MDESGYYRGQRRFLFAGKDLLQRVRNDLAHVHINYSHRYEHAIPVMDKFGRLLFEVEEIRSILSPRARIGEDLGGEKAYR